MARRTLLLLVCLLAFPGAAAAVSSGTNAAHVELRSVEGAVPYGDGRAIPLRGKQPDWFTPALAAQVDAADGIPVAAPLDAPLPSEIGIRPGSWMIAPYGCTMNFVFERNGQYAIGTAGHCADGVGDPVVLLTLAPGGANPVFVEIGQVIAHHDDGIGDDFALVTIRSELRSWVSATMAVVGGPCGAYAGSGPETVWHYGHGLAIGTGGTPRAGLALSWKRDAFGWDGAAIFGDSGSGVRVGTGLQAAGDLTHLVVDTKWLPSHIAGTRIQKMLQIANGWSLVSSPLCL